MAIDKEDEVINFAKDIIYLYAQDEFKVFDMFSSSLYSSLNDEYDILEEHSYFGDQAELISYSILAIIAFVANDLRKVGVELTKYFFNEYFEENKDFLYEKFKSKNGRLALQAIEKYLKNETKS
jgi:hypothetical protein